MSLPSFDLIGQQTTELLQGLCFLTFQGLCFPNFQKAVKHSYGCENRVMYRDCPFATNDEFRTKGALDSASFQIHIKTSNR